MKSTAKKLPAASFEVVGTQKISTEDAKEVSRVLREEMGGERLDTRECRRALIDRSRPKDSSTHHLFEWDPKKQSELYLYEQAGRIIRSVFVVFEAQPEIKIREFPTMVVGGKKGPIPTEQVFKRRNLTAQLLEQAKKDALVWARRYESLRKVAQLRNIFRAIDKL